MDRTLEFSRAAGFGAAEALALRANLAQISADLFQHAVLDNELLDRLLLLQQRARCIGDELAMLQECVLARGLVEDARTRDMINAVLVQIAQFIEQFQDCYGAFQQYHCEKSWRAVLAHTLALTRRIAGMVQMTSPPR